MKKFIGKNLFLVIMILMMSVVFVVSVQAQGVDGCCQTVKFEAPRHLTIAVDSYNVSKTECDQYCKNDTAKACRFEPGVSANIGANACAGDNGGCCQISNTFYAQRFAYYAKDDNGCKFFCSSGFPGCAYLFKVNYKPNAKFTECLDENGNSQSKPDPNGDGCCEITCTDPDTGLLLNFQAVNTKKAGCTYSAFKCPVIFKAGMLARNNECITEQEAINDGIDQAGIAALRAQGWGTGGNNNYGADDTTYKGADKAAAQAIMKEFKFDTPKDPLKYAGGNPAIVIGKVISGLLLILGSLALIMFIYGGFTWMTAMGNEKRVETATKVLVWSTAGLITIFLSYIVVGFLLDTATNPSAVIGSGNNINSNVQTPAQTPGTTTPTNGSGSATLVVGQTQPDQTESIINIPLTVDDNDIPADWATRTSAFPVPNSTDLYFVVGKGTGYSQSEAGTLALDDAKTQIAETFTNAGYQIAKTKTVSGGMGNATTIYYLVVFKSL